MGRYLRQRNFLFKGCINTLEILGTIILFIKKNR